MSITSKINNKQSSTSLPEGTREGQRVTDVEKEHPSQFSLDGDSRVKIGPSSKTSSSNPILKARAEKVIQESKTFFASEFSKEPYCRDFDKGSFGPFDKSFDKVCPA